MVIQNIDKSKYLGETHVSNICTKANMTFGILGRTLYTCLQDVKDAAYERLARPVQGYDSSVWDPHGVAVQE